MKKPILLAVSVILSGQFAFSQAIDHINGEEKRSLFNNLPATRVYNGTKTIITGLHDLDIKRDVEKLFFGDFNALVEFFYSPPFDSASGLRIVRDPSNISYILEVKYIPNWGKVRMEMEKRFPRRSITPEEVDSMSDSIYEQNARYNEDMRQKSVKESLRHYDVQTLSFSVPYLGKKLYDKIVRFVDAFTPISMPHDVLDGNTSTFRCVVGDEVWSLNILEPQKRALQLSDICRQIIEDAQADKFDELKYVNALESMQF